MPFDLNALKANLDAVQATLLRVHALNKGDTAEATRQEAREIGFRAKLNEVTLGTATRNVARGSEAKAIDHTEGKISGWASTMDVDAFGHIVVNGAFEAAIKRRGLTGSLAIKLLLDHDWSKPAGLITKLEYRTTGGVSGQGGLWMEAQLDLSIQYVRDRWSVMKMVEGHSFSVGFILQEYLEPKPNSVAAKLGASLLITTGDLFEVSLVLFPANEAATAGVGAKSKLQELVTTLERLNASLKT